MDTQLQMRTFAPRIPHIPRMAHNALYTAHGNANCNIGDMMTHNKSMSTSTLSVTHKSNTTTLSTVPMSPIAISPAQTKIEVTKVTAPSTASPAAFACSECGKVFKHKSNLKIHGVIHTAQALRCSFCDKKFARKGNLKQHLRVHTDERPYACRYCPKYVSISHICSDGQTDRLTD